MIDEESEETEKKEGEAYFSPFGYICLQIENGMSLRKAIRSYGMGNDTFYKILNESKENQERYARACEERGEAIFDEIIDIADETGADKYTDENGVERTDNEAIQRSKLRIDARKWMLSKLQPKKYGDKIEVDANVTAVTTILSLGSGIDPNAEVTP